jgi:hypothetical protein
MRDTQWPVFQVQRRIVRGMEIVRSTLCGALLLAVAAILPLLPAAQAAPTLAPAFTLPLLSGGTLSSAAFKGKGAVVLFWAPW